MRIFILIFFVFLFPFLGSAQDSLKTKNFTFELLTGGVMSSFQDTKYTNVKYTGLGVVYGFDFMWRKKSIIGFGAKGIYSKEKPKTFDKGYPSVNDAQFYFKYLYPIKKNEKYNLFVGTKVDLFDFTMRINPELTNNSAYVILGGGVKAYTMFEKKINDTWKVDAGIGFQLFSFMNEYMSFGYMANQNTLEKGEYNYEDAAMPWSFTPFWKYLNIETNIRFYYKRRWVFGYAWRMQQSYQVENYPMTKGYSALYVAYRIINKEKSISK